MCTAINHPVPDRVKPSFVIFDSLALWRPVLKRNLWQINIRNIASKSRPTFSGLQRCRWRHGSVFNRLVLPSESPKSREVLKKFELIAVQGHPSSTILVPIESAYATSYSSIVTLQASPTVLEILTQLAQNSLFLPKPPLFDALNRGTPCNINVIYTRLKSKFNGLQFCCWQYGSNFIC